MIELEAEFVRQAVSQALEVYSGATDKHPKPLRIEVENGSLRVSAGYIQGATAFVLGKKSPDFYSLILPGEPFFRALGRKGMVQIEKVNSDLMIRRGKTETVLQGEDAEYYAERYPALNVPHMELPDLGPEIPGLKTALEKAVRFSAKKDYQQVLRHIAVQPSGDEAIIVGSDGFRIVATRLPWNVGEQVPLGEQLLLHGRDLRGVLKLDGELRFRFDAPHIFIGDSVTTFKIEREEGTYPDWGRIMPHHVNRMRVNREQLEDAVRRALLLAPTEELSAVWVLLQPGSDIATIRAEGVYGSSGEQLELLEPHGFDEARHFRFNGKYLLELVTLHEGQEVSLAADGVYTPCRADDGATQFLIVPLRAAATAV